MKTEITNMTKTHDIQQLLTGFIAEGTAFYEELPQASMHKVMNEETAARLEAMTIPTDGRNPEAVYQEMKEDVYSSVLMVQHPRSFACIPSSMSLVSWMGDVMTNLYNPHASCEMNGPAVNLIEKKLIDWLCGLAGYPHETSGGLFVSGGSIANLTALTAARDAKLTEQERTLGVVYVPDQTHSSVCKGLHIIGFRKDQIRIIASDEAFRMDIETLRKAVQTDADAGRKPFAVVASAGTTNTGSVDPLTEIANLCETYNMWMHVDGAFGASALLSDTQRKKLTGIERSDSLSWDAHKWMQQTYGCSMVLVRNKINLTRSFLAHPEYLKDAAGGDENIEFWDLGPELTRPARALKLWMSLQILGTDYMAECIDHSCRLAELAEAEIRKLSGWEILSPAQFGIVNFRYVPDTELSEQSMDALQSKIAEEVTNSGYALIFTTELKGKKVLRLCMINPRTTAEDVQSTICLLDRFSREIR